MWFASFPTYFYSLFEEDLTLLRLFDKHVLLTYKKKKKPNENRRTGEGKTRCERQGRQKILLR